MFRDVETTDIATEGRGKRHTVKSKRWEVIECQDPFLKGTWLDHVAAKGLLKQGDFYPEYTRIRVYPSCIEFTVKGNQAFDEDGELIELA